MSLQAAPRRRSHSAHERPAPSHVAALDSQVRQSPESLNAQAPAGDVYEAMRRTQHWLLRRQESEGYWCAELEGDTILESEFLLLWAFLGRLDDPLCAKLGRYMLEQQAPHGGWAIYPGGPIEISASVKAYFALKLLGYDPRSDAMRRAREAILAAGGADRINSFTRFYLALLGQIPYACCPEVPPEFILLPDWSPINKWGVSAWSRPMIVTLSIMSALRPVTSVRDEHGISELFVRPPHEWEYNRCVGLRPSLIGKAWEWFFRSADRSLKLLRRVGCLPLRKKAIAKSAIGCSSVSPRATDWRRFFRRWFGASSRSRALGHTDDSPEQRHAIERLKLLVIEERRNGSRAALQIAGVGYVDRAAHVVRKRRRSRRAATVEDGTLVIGPRSPSPRRLVCHGQSSCGGVGVRVR
ncbi:MAG: hypothetical protein QM811_16245 [Pirellulales bacterium]